MPALQVFSWNAGSFNLVRLAASIPHLILVSFIQRLIICISDSVISNFSFIPDDSRREIIRSAPNLLFFRSSIDRNDSIIRLSFLILRSAMLKGIRNKSFAWASNTAWINGAYVSMSGVITIISFGLRAGISSNIASKLSCSTSISLMGLWHEWTWMEVSVSILIENLFFACSLSLKYNISDWTHESMSYSAWSSKSSYNSQSNPLISSKKSLPCFPIDARSLLPVSRWSSSNAEAPATYFLLILFFSFSETISAQ